MRAVSPSIPGCLHFAVMQDRLDDAAQTPDRTAAPKPRNGAVLDTVERLHPLLVETTFARKHGDDGRQQGI